MRLRRLNGHQFDLHTILLWFLPYGALCLIVLTVGREPTMSPGRGIPIYDWRRLVTISVITLVWAVLVWEDRRARRRHQRASDAAKQRV